MLHLCIIGQITIRYIELGRHELDVWLAKAVVAYKTRAVAGKCVGNVVGVCTKLSTEHIYNRFRWCIHLSVATGTGCPLAYLGGIEVFLGRTGPLR